MREDIKAVGTTNTMTNPHQQLLYSNPQIRLSAVFTHGASSVEKVERLDTKGLPSSMVINLNGNPVGMIDFYSESDGQLVRVTIAEAGETKTVRLDCGDFDWDSL